MEKTSNFLTKPHETTNIKKVIGVVSGKGGVGKSLVTSMLAVSVNRRGYKTSILDADITGPSIPKVFGLTERALGSKDGIKPNSSETGIDIMSVNLVVKNASDPVLWRGPIVTSAVKQFWSDVLWGDVDYMFIDMPPGTGEVALTIFQSIPLDGIVIVASPQELVSMIVEKAVKMAKLMNIPILGLVENMSYFLCDSCDKKHYIFGESHIDEIAKEYQLKVLAKIPMISEIAALCDKGRIEDYRGNWMDELTKELEEMIK